jgi:hypothetical protein
MKRIFTSRTKQVAKTKVARAKKGFRTPPHVIEAHRSLLRTRNQNDIEGAAESIPNDRRSLFRELYRAFSDNQTLENYLMSSAA